MFLNSRGVLEERSPRTEGKLVSTTEVKYISDIEVRVAVIVLNSAAVHGGAAILFPNPAIQKVSGIAPGPGKRVIRQKIQTLR